MCSLGLLILRLGLGGLLIGHGAQKLFGWFGGFGLQGIAGWFGSMGLKPPERWAQLAGLSELGGGLLTALGLGGALGPIATMGSMLVATGTVHRGKPIWVTAGGAELPVTNLAIASALAVAGPGRFSLDRVFGIRVPWWLTAITLAATAGASWMATSSYREMPAPQEQTTGENLQIQEVQSSADALTEEPEQEEELPRAA
jgi:putative oxidoreductase